MALVAKFLSSGKNPFGAGILNIFQLFFRFSANNKSTLEQTSITHSPLFLINKITVRRISRISLVTKN